VPSAGPPAWLRVAFPPGAHAPPADVVLAAGSLVGLRARQVADDRARARTDQHLRLRLGVSEELVGTLDTDEVIAAARNVLVPDLADAVVIDRDSAGPTTGPEVVRVPEAGEPAVAMV